MSRSEIKIVWTNKNEFIGIGHNYEDDEFIYKRTTNINVEWENNQSDTDIIKMAIDKLKSQINDDIIVHEANISLTMF